MTEPDNLVLRQLRDLRSDMDRRFDETWQEIELVKRRLDSQSQAIIGESVMGRYTVAEVEEQLGAISTRLDALEASR